MRRERLSARTVGRARGATLPDYERAGQPSITHVGFGAFARAHLGLYADDLLRRGRPALIRAVSIHSTRLRDQLTPQDCLYTVAECEPDEPPRLRVVGAVSSIASGVGAAFEALISPSTRLVTLTVTEKGYEIGPERARPGDGATVPGLIARALATRRRAGIAPPILAPLDNLSDNGGVLRAAVLDEAGRFDTDLAAWIGGEVAFVSSVVDRMVPAPSVGDLEEVSSRLGLDDGAAVVAEHHRSWVIQGARGLEPLGDVGVQIVDDVSRFDQRKLWLLNGPHSAVAYCGMLAGCDTIAEAVSDPSVMVFVRRLVSEILEGTGLSSDLRAKTFAEEALHRFSNPFLHHACTQVGADGSRKLPQRLLPVIAQRKARGLSTTRFSVVVAVWIAAVSGIPVAGVVLPLLEDPLAGLLRSAGSRQLDVGRLVDLALDDRWQSERDEVAQALNRLTTMGPEMLGIAGP